MKLFLLNIFMFIFFTNGSLAIDWGDLLDPFGIFHNKADPEAKMTVSQVISYHGYPVEEYDVTTEDGYILSVHRIPHGKYNTDTSVRRKPVLIQHGILADSSCWILNTPDKNLPYLLAEKGYDVWLGNFRGNTFGRRHTTLSPEEKEFWMFSFDEMAKYDLPALIDFVLNITGFRQLHYVGHSMGTTVPFIMLSTQPEYNDKIRSLNALAPVARLDHTSSPILKSAMLYQKLDIPLVKLFMGYEYLPSSKLTETLGRSFCEWTLTGYFCSNAIFLVTGFDNEEFNVTRLPVYLHFFPAGTSTQAIEHYGQIGYYHRFQAFDHGKTKNLQYYNQTTPPEYDVSKITSQVALYYGSSDWISGPKDVQFLIQNLKNLKLDYLVPFSKFNHGDFVWANDVIPLVYNKLFETMDELWKD